MIKFLENIFKQKEKNQITVKGRYVLTCTDKDGNVRWEVKKDNLIMNAGRAILSALAGNVGSPAPFIYLAVGSSTTAPAATQTALGSEFSTNGLGRASATASLVTTNVANDTLQLVHAWSVTGTSDIEEVGVFNAASGPTMLGRSLTTTNNVYNGDTLTLTYQIVFA